MEKRPIFRYILKLHYLSAILGADIYSLGDETLIANITRYLKFDKIMQEIAWTILW